MCMTFIISFHNDGCTLVRKLIIKISFEKQFKARAFICL